MGGIVASFGGASQAIKKCDKMSHFFIDIGLLGVRLRSTPRIGGLTFGPTALELGGVRDGTIFECFALFFKT